MTAAKPTPGPWLVRNPDNGIYDTEDEIANVVARGPYGLITLAEEVDLADARLIAEAGTVYHETGLTPRELAEQRAELLEALEDAVSHYGRPGGPWNVLEGPGAWITKARTAIAKARGGAA